MQPKTKLILTLAMLTLVTLACATVTGGNTSNEPAPLAAIPTNTPLPPPPTSTPLPPEPEPEPQPEMGTELFFDDFSDPNSGWDRYSDDDGITDYENGAYKIGIYIDTYFYWANPYQNFGDQVIEVEASLTTIEEDNQYGIVCRHLDVDNWYALVISGDGTAAIRKRYQGSELEYIVDWTATAAVNKGQATNNLRAECIGTRLSLYVNGVLALETIDADIPTGDAGLIAGTFDSTLTEVLFDNFRVTEP